MKVRLNKDLTKYHPTLIVGIEGEAIGAYGTHSKKFPKAFVGVRFPKHTLDVMWEDLVILKEERKPYTVGPQLTITLPKPPKRDQVLTIEGMEFKIHSIAEDLGEGVYLVNVQLST